MLWIIFFVIVLLLLVYVFARKYLLERPAFKAFCCWVDPLITSWLSKSRQIAIARLTGIGGLIVAMMNTMGDIPMDWTMAGDWIVTFFPEQMQPFVQKMLLPAAIWGYGEFMRHVTVEPLAAKE